MTRARVEAARSTKSAAAKRPKGNKTSVSGVCASVTRLLAIFVAVLTFVAQGTALDLVPDALGDFVREDAQPIAPEESDLFAEFGFEEGQRGEYRTEDARRLVVEAYRFQDATGGFAGYQWIRPDTGEFVPYGERALQQGDTTVIHFGNFVVRMTGDEAIDEHVEAMLAFLPRATLQSAPPVLKFVPKRGLVPFSGRYVLGPESLARVATEVPPSVAAFRYGTEAEFLRYESDAGALNIVLFYYPSPQIAQGQLSEFEAIPDILVKRSGPIVAAVLSPPSKDEAERLLSRVRYTAEITVAHQTESRQDNLGTLILDIVIFCALLAVLMIVGGSIVAGSRIMARRFWPNSILAPSESGDMVRLDLGPGPGRGGESR